MEDFNIEEFLAIPDETKRNILSFFTNVKEIFALGSQSPYLQHLLYQSVTHFNTDEDYYYLDARLLSLYRSLREVSDNLIFDVHIESPNSIIPKIHIPLNLKKFNLRLVTKIISREQLPSYQSIVSNLISEILRQLIDNNAVYQIPHLRNYTVRVIINDYGFHFKDCAFVIDNGSIIFFDDLLPSNPRGARLNFNWIETFKNVGINIANFDGDKTLIPYYMSIQNLADGRDFFIRNACYPDSLTAELLNIIIEEMNLDLKGYLLTGYLSIDLGGSIILEYFQMILGVNNDIPENLRHKLSRFEKYLSLNLSDYTSISHIANEFQGKMISSMGIISVSHLYLIEPSILQLIQEDEEKFRLRYL